MNLLYFLPVSAIGINLNGFILGPLLFSMIGIASYKAVITLQHKKHQYVISKSSLILVCLAIFFVFTNVGRNSLSSYVLPLSAFFILGVIAFEGSKSWPSSNKHQKIVKRSFWVLFFICIFEVIFSNLLPGIWSLVEALDFFSGSSNSYFGFRRIRAFTSEPASLAKLLVLYHLLLRFYLPRINKTTSVIEIYANLMLVAMTLSNTAILGILMLEFVAFFASKKKKLRSRPSLLTYKSLQNLILMVGTIGITIYFSDAALKLLERFNLVIVALSNNVVTGSVGFRATAIVMPYIYLSEVTGTNFWLGEGFSNFSNWLITQYGHEAFSGFAQGQPGNVFSAMTLSGGLIGIFLYVVLLISPVRRLDNLNLAALTFVLFLSATSGNVTSPFFWTLISIAYGICKVNEMKIK